MNEKMSCLMDGELDRDEAHVAIRQLGADASMREQWETYHLIGDALRGESIAGAAVAVQRHQRAADIFAKLADEPTILVPAVAKRVAKTAVIQQRTRVAIAMAATVVTVSAITVVALKQQQGSTVAPIQAVQQASLLQATTTSAADLQSQNRVNDYLAIHRQFANPGAFQAATMRTEVPREVSRQKRGNQVDAANKESAAENAVVETPRRAAGQ